VTTSTLPSYPVHSGRSPAPGEHHSASPLRSAARGVLLLALCAAPWAIGCVQPWAWGTLIALIFLAFLVWGLDCVYRGTVKISWTPLYWPFLAFAVLAILQWATGLNADHVATREALVKLLGNLALFFLAGQLLTGAPENGRTLERFGLIVSLLSFALCALALAQLLWSPDPRMIYWTYRAEVPPFGPYVNHNDYAGLMEMLLPMAIGYILSRAALPLLRPFLWGGVVLVIVSVWLSGSRGGAVVLVVEGLLWSAILLWRRPRGTSFSSFPVLLGVALVSAVIFSWLVGPGHIRSNAWSIFRVGRPLDVTLGDRLRVGVDTLRMAAHHPWVGIGVGCFERAFPPFISFPSYLHWTHAHDDIIEAVAETGLLGVGIMLAGFGIFLGLAFRNMESRLEHRRGWIQVGAAVGSVGLLVHSLVDFNLRIPANAAWFVVCVAVATHLRLSSGRSRRVTQDVVSEPQSGFVT
jgi:O-antigen ligase